VSARRCSVSSDELDAAALGAQQVAQVVGVRLDRHGRRAPSGGSRE
jgi:hypothetical protein